MTIDPPMITAIATILTPLGAAAAFLFRRHDKSIKEIKVELAEHKTELEACRKRKSDSREGRAIQRTVIEMFWQELERLSPGSPILARAKRLLDRYT